MPFKQAPFDPQRARQLHAQLVEQLMGDGLLDDPELARAFQIVPRHLFLPDHTLEQIYSDQALAVKRKAGAWVSSSSQPGMMAIMLAQLGLQPGHRVLEIGTGTGYNAALIAAIVGATGRVVSVDLEADLIKAARVHLDQAGYPEVDLRHADGALGAPDAAPFDRIIVTAGAWDLVPAWRTQLVPGGRIVVPMTIFPSLMLSLAFEQRGSVWEALSAHPCGFVLLRGSEAHPGRDWTSPRLVLHPRDERTTAIRSSATIEKEWSQIVVVWDEPHSPLSTSNP
ncbi:methyltransferase domain-containing protein [Candidatus Chloroploca sp. Khr17]|uniref:methyltransferase domain-containing protein n=1 Tax=Candidatus Chloroploca sp. Khr17 TaxID=2496869 RepID=UPI00101D8DC9|nr:methyltransferase domain-containing protein [Candidatus Chloroploca sp. Khr17]